MAEQKLPDSDRIKRLRAAGLSYDEIARRSPISKARVHQLLQNATDLPKWTRAKVDVDLDAGTVTITGDVDVRVIHAAVVSAIERAGAKVDKEKA